MSSARTGNALILIAALWTLGLVFVWPAGEASTFYRSMVFSTALALIALVLLSDHLTATWTMLAFSILGVTLSVAVFGTFGVGLAGFVSPLLLAVAMWVRRDRLDGRVVVWSIVLASLGIWLPHYMVAGWYIMALVNAVIWMVNRLKGSRRNSQTGLQI